MSSPEQEPSRAPPTHGVDRRAATRGTVGPLLDAAFGLFVWMVHLLVIYIAVAVACGFGLVHAGTSEGGGLVAFLVVVTVAAALLVGFHAWRRWQQHGAEPDGRFRLSVTIGCDAIAAVGILWQLLAIGVIPPCT